jgi:hypothetical protein
MKKITFALIAIFGLSGCVTAEPVVTVSASEAAQPTQEVTLEPKAEEALENLHATELAASLAFSFDNFQCNTGYDCKAIYEVRYFGAKKKHQVRELLFMEGYVWSSVGSRAEVGVIAIQDEAGLASGYLEPGVTYTAIINTDSKLNDEYDSIYLESHGAAILDDYFGCFISEQQLVSSTPTC